MYLTLLQILYYKYASKYHCKCNFFSFHLNNEMIISIINCGNYLFILGFYQPAGPLIRSASPSGGQSSAGGSSPSHPPTATVQPTVFCTTAISSTSTRSATVSGATRGSSAATSDYKGSANSGNGSTSPVKPRPQSAATFSATAAPTAYSYSAAAASSAYGLTPYPPPGYPGAYPAPPPAHAAPGTPFYPYPPTATPFYPISHHPYATYPALSASEGVAYPYPPTSMAVHPSIAPPPPHAAYPGQYLVTPFQQIASESGVNSSLVDPAGRTTQVALPGAASGYYYGGYSYPYSAAAGRIIAPILALGALNLTFKLTFAYYVSLYSQLVFLVT